jgi:hypothetical protein
MAIDRDIAVSSEDLGDSLGTLLAARGGMTTTAGDTYEVTHPAASAKAYRERALRTGGIMSSYQSLLSRDQARLTRVRDALEGADRASRSLM